MTRADAHVAIVGAGIAGLGCGAELARAGVRVSLFDKGRGSGGRCATRRAGPFAFDHGAQFATATDQRFRRLLSTARRQDPRRLGGRVRMGRPPSGPGRRTAGSAGSACLR